MEQRRTFLNFDIYAHLNMCLKINAPCAELAKWGNKFYNQLCMGKLRQSSVQDGF